jgi:hypothetical protein
MNEYITPFAKQELKVIVDELKEAGAELKFITWGTGVDTVRLKRLRANHSCRFNNKEFSEIVKFYAGCHVNRK